MTTADDIVCGMYLKQGFENYLRDNNLDHVLVAAIGDIECAIILSELAAPVRRYTDKWIEVRDADAGGRPGVLEYEVWEPLGSDIAHHMDTQAQSPWSSVVLGLLHDRLDSFYRDVLDELKKED